MKEIYDSWRQYAGVTKEVVADARERARQFFAAEGLASG